MDKIIDLKGEWNLKLEEQDAGSQGAGSIMLPTTVTASGYGVKNDREEKLYLSEKFQFTGKAEFARTFELKEEDLAGGKRVLFTMERSRVTTTVVNGKCAGTRDLLTTAQVLDITDLVRCGENTIEVTVDNTLETVPKAPILGSHMASEHTQTNWNGIVGKIFLRIAPAISLGRINVYPSAAEHSARIKAIVFSTKNEETQVRLAVRQPEFDDAVIAQGIFHINKGENILELSGKLAEETPLWSEFHPELTEIEVSLEIGENNGESDSSMSDRRTVTFGLRDFTVSEDRHHFAMNGKKIFLRSEANNAVFPLTGYAPMEEESWEKLFAAYKDYGVNYVRCHSWCPPEAAFSCADRLGLYIQPELCEWTFHTFEDDAEYDYYSREAMAILDAYGNHPSFVAMTWGNELRSDNRARMSELIYRMKDYDPTRLYAEGSNTWYGRTEVNPDCDFVLTQGYYKTKWRGSYAGNWGFVNDDEPAEMRNFAEPLSKIDKPVVSFEVGQYQVYPDYREIDKYTGPLEARNLAAYKRQLEEKGLAGHDREFHMASGKLAKQCYREEIEMAMRTPNQAGVSLLGLQDFSGQGTALVGMLDALGDSKDFVTAEEFHHFFNAVVPMLEFDRKIFYPGETEKFSVLVHNFGDEDMTEPVKVTVKDGEGKVLLSETWNDGGSEVIPQGELSRIGDFEFTMPEVSAEKIVDTITLEAEVGGYRNAYEILVYARQEMTERESRVIIRELNKENFERLENGESLVLFPSLTSAALPESYPASYISDFWCWFMFRRFDASGTMGLSPDPAAAVFKEFPTKDHTDPRWWHLLRGARACLLTDTGIQPLIPMIDNLQRNDSLAVAFEVRVGAGKLVVCTLNPEGGLKDVTMCQPKVASQPGVAAQPKVTVQPKVTEQPKVAAQPKVAVQPEVDRQPAAAAFIKAMADYVLSEECQPEKSVTAEELYRLVPGDREAVRADEATVSAGYKTENAENVLKSNTVFWDTVGLEGKENSWLEVKFSEPRTVDTVQIMFAESDAYATGGVELDLPGSVKIEYFDGTWKPVEVLFRPELSNSEGSMTHFKPVKSEVLRIRFGSSEVESVNVAAISDEDKPFAVDRVYIY